jgi:L-alanine-DL-glutamate epimerase-like enolase superfamily enzyme
MALTGVVDRTADARSVTHALRVEAVDVVVLSFPLEKPFRAAVRLIPTVDVVVARVRAGGLEGVGYAFAFGRDEAVALAGLVRLLGTRLTSTDALAIESAWESLWRSLALLGQAGASVSALAALDIALWDLRGKAFGVPLHRLLGSARARIPTYGSGGSLDQSAAELAAEMAGYAAAGHRAVKLKLGHGLAGDHARLEAVRRAIGANVQLIVDGNQQWTVKQAIVHACGIAEFDLWWLEEPVAASRIADCAAVRAAVPMAIATGETNFTPAECHALVSERAADIIMPNLQRVGGITPWRKVAAAAELAGVPIASHVNAEINVHLMCAVPNGLTLEIVPWWPRIFREQLEFSDGHAVPPDRPGLGVTLDPDVVARHRIDRS